MVGMQEKTYQRIIENLHKFEFDIEGNLVNRKPYYRPNGYVTLRIKGVTTAVHQIIAVMKYGKQAIGMEVNHIDGDKWNNKPCNLELVTPKENIRHMISLGKQNVARGSRSAKSKLIESDVLMIRELLSKGIPPLKIANQFKVSDECIYAIKNKKTWTHI